MVLRPHRIGIVRLTDPVTGIPTAHGADTVGYLDSISLAVQSWLHDQPAATGRAARRRAR